MIDKTFSDDWIRLPHYEKYEHFTPIPSWIAAITHAFLIKKSFENAIIIYILFEFSAITICIPNYHWLYACRSSRPQKEITTQVVIFFQSQTYQSNLFSKQSRSKIGCPVWACLFADQILIKAVVINSLHLSEISSLCYNLVNLLTYSKLKSIIRKEK